VTTVDSARLRTVTTNVQRIVRLAVRLKVLGPTPLMRLKIALTTVAMPIKRRMRWAAPRWIELRIARFGRELPLVVSDISEMQVLADVLLDEQYELPRGIEPRTIVDLGSHIGVSIAYFRMRHPEARIIGLEPDPVTFRKLQRNVRGLPNVMILNLAASHGDGPVTLFRGAQSWTASLISRDASRPEVLVEGRSLATLLDELELPWVDVLKLDVEGAELDVLRSLPDLSQRVGLIVGELHHWMDGVNFAPQDLLALLTDYDVETDASGSDYLLRAVRSVRSR
jgi:FkbM family methyltransferase